jgi:hypothetical protein
MSGQLFNEGVYSLDLRQFRTLPVPHLVSVVSKDSMSPCCQLLSMGTPDLVSLPVLGCPAVSFEMRIMAMGGEGPVADPLAELLCQVQALCTEYWNGNAILPLTIAHR